MKGRREDDRKKGRRMKGRGRMKGRRIKGRGGWVEDER